MSLRRNADHNDEAVLRISVPGYRGRYGPGDFTNPDARSLDNQIAHYACSFTRQAPWNSPKKLVLRLTEASREDAKEQRTADAYHVMFRARAQTALQKFGEQIPLVAILIVMAVSLLWLSHQVESLSWDEETAKTAAEAVRLGAWISGWTAISLLFSRGVESLRNHFAFRRLMHIPIEFEYSQASHSTRNSTRSTSGSWQTN